MEQKMSVGLDTNQLSIGMPGQPWIPTPSPTLKLQTPSLEPLAVSNTDWRAPLSANPPHFQHHNFSTGLTPRYSPAFAASPGVSADIAGVVENPNQQPSTSLSDLFASPDYPFSQVKAARSPNQKGQQAQRNPPTSSPPASTPQASAAQQARPPAKPAQPTMQFAASTAYARTMSQALPAAPAPLGPPASAAFSTPMSQAQPAAQAQLGHAYQPVNAPLSQPIATVSGVSTAAAAATAAASAAAQPVNYGAYSMSMLQQQQVPAQPVAAAAPRAEQVIAPLPARSGGELEKKEESPGGIPTTGHRSVLGSGIVSSAVQEAQVRARMKAETFAKMRKRKRHDEPTEEDKEKQSEEDAKLTPEQLRKKRYMRRLALNRESAAVSRVRRREYVKLLEEQLVNAEKERVRLATELAEMQRQHNKLREHLDKLERSVQDGGGEIRTEGYRQ